MAFLTSGKGGSVTIVETRAESLVGWGDGFDVGENVIPW